MGTRTRGMIRHCTEAGLPEPEFAVRDGFRTIILKLYSRYKMLTAE
ncbi:hypothetical protein [Methanoculleus formosensis]|nr:hypothetical protein [Methanoculleus sp. Afa-1]